MTPLAKALRRTIEAEGPIPVSLYMARCLGDPEHGYYMTRDPFGTKGDFTTAPEVSQIFGELMGAVLADYWLKAGCPAPVRLIEIGPGRGTLMKDALSVLARLPGFLAAADLHLVETSPALRTIQTQTLQGAPLSPRHHETMETVPQDFALILANEFFDALPVDQIECRAGHWHQRLIGLDAEGNFRFGLGNPVPGPARPAPDGTVIEIAPARASVMGRIAARLKKGGGLFVTADYGAAQSGFGDTLQAVKAHRFADPFAAPGDADLTTQVDFAALAEAARAAGARIYGPLAQGSFLLRLGLLERAGRLGAGKPQATQEAISLAVERLAGDAGMGQLFKVMAVGDGRACPAPFDQDRNTDARHPETA